MSAFGPKQKADTYDKYAEKADCPLEKRTGGKSSL